METLGEIMQLCLKAGAIMLRNGAETSRVEETVRRMALSFGVREVHSFVTPTGIFISLNEETKLIRIYWRKIDLDKVSQVNQISRTLAEGKMSLTEAYRRMVKIDRQRPIYPLGLTLVSSGIASASFTLLFGGAWSDSLVGFVVGVTIQLMFSMFLIEGIGKFFFEWLAPIVAGVISFTAVKLGWTHLPDSILTGALMLLVPGVAITNAVRDILSGDLVSGMARGAEAAITAISVAAGVATVIAIF